MLINNKEAQSFLYKSDPQKLMYSHSLVNNADCKRLLDNIFIVFESIYKETLLIYCSLANSIIIYNINNEQAISEIKNPHIKFITNFRHILDKINIRDLILSVSGRENNIKVWNCTNWECILNLENIWENGFLSSSCFLIDNLKNMKSYIIMSNNLNNNCIIIYDIDAKKYIELEKKPQCVGYIDVYYDKILFKYFIISGNLANIKSYDFDTKKLYKEYHDSSSNNVHMSITVYTTNKMIKLIESDTAGFIRIWNFHLGELIKKIKVSDNNLKGICVWNEKYIFVACSDGKIRGIDIINEGVNIILDGHGDKAVCSIKKIYHHKYGECLISQAYKDNQIKVWKCNNK